MAPQCATYNGVINLCKSKIPSKKAQSDKASIVRESPMNTSDLPTTRFLPQGEETVTLEKIEEGLRQLLVCKEIMH
ncbi:hypothetical protein Tco_0369362 [Tanacetum coccineum]